MNLAALGIGSIIDGVGKVADVLFTSDEERLKVAIQEKEIEAGVMKAQMAVNQEESKHSSLFVAGWRPFIGWVGGAQVSRNVVRGVNFVGYRTWRNRRLIRKYSLYKFRRAVKKGDALAVISLLGHAKNTQSLPHLVRTLKETDHAQSLPLPQRVRRLHGLPGPGRGLDRTL